VGVHVWGIISAAATALEATVGFNREIDLPSAFTTKSIWDGLFRQIGAHPTWSGELLLVDVLAMT
jgi:hypothetical protein